ncbi:MAG TPA: putative baseplate assembly protein [Acidimicrobiales bacterium]|jgi:predicted phage baseplate assembly protein|nr:putative baseplate assembly protein [Acidimicrobiales bacterium]
MTLPVPNLDDRNFQSLVDDAKRMVQQRCPEWTDHNVSDPGVTLIETFAYMVDQLIWRLNRVPDRIYVKFLELLGVKLQAPAAATAPVTFWLSTSLEENVHVPHGTQAATSRGEDEPVVFTTTEALDIVPSSRGYVVTEINNLQVNQTETLDSGQAFLCFDRVPNVGDCFYIGLSNAAPRCVVSLEFECSIEGVGVNPDYPPLVWEAWNGDTWEPCDLERDTTGGLNRNGEVVLHLPVEHTAHAAILRLNAGWIRCRVTEPVADWAPAYSASPRIHRVSAATIGGTAEAVNAEIITDEIVGMSEGVPSQRFRVEHPPIVPVEAGYVVEVSSIEGWQEWTQVEDFAMSGDLDRHFQLDENTGEVVFGPAIRQPDGSVRQYGAVPPKGGAIRLPQYRSGGGSRGNVARNTITVLQDQVPFVNDTSNRRPGLGGLDAETIEDAKLRGPLLLRTRNRAVTRADYERLAEEAHHHVARARCIPAGEDGTEAGGVRVHIVPHVEEDENGAIEFGDLLPNDDVLSAIADYLDERRTIGARVKVESARYAPLSVVALLRAKPRHDSKKVEKDAVAALYTYFHPIRGGSDGRGWPFGRQVTQGEAYAVLQAVPGVEAVEQVRIYPASPIEGTRAAEVQTLPVEPNALVFSWGHQVNVRSR